jgi:hypothetical protein
MLVEGLRLHELMTQYEQQLLSLNQLSADSTVLRQTRDQLMVIFVIRVYLIHRTNVTSISWCSWWFHVT